VFKPAITDLDAVRDHYTKPGKADFLSFLKNIGFPIFFHDGGNLAAYYFKRATGIIPGPAADSEEIIESAYGEIERICEQNHARMAIVIITDPGESRKPTPGEIQKLEGIPKVIIVNTEPALFKALPEATKKAYDSAYRIWRGSPPVGMDIHPNEIAHRIFAAEIIKTLEPSRPVK
jgi:hypothetical protein